MPNPNESSPVNPEANDALRRPFAPHEKGELLPQHDARLKLEDKASIPKKDDRVTADEMHVRAAERGMILVEPRRYPIGDRLSADLQARFSYHAPQPDQFPRYAKLREYAKAFATTLCETCPPSRELSLALTHLEETVMFANAAIARHEGTGNRD